MTFTELKLVWRLVFAHARQHPGRMLLTAISTIAAACIVVWVVSGYDSLHDKFGNMAENYMGRYSLLVLSTESGDGPGGAGGGMFGRSSNRSLSRALVKELRNSDEIEAVDVMFEAQARIRSASTSADEFDSPIGGFGGFGNSNATSTEGKSDGKDGETRDGNSKGAASPNGSRRSRSGRFGGSKANDSKSADAVADAKSSDGKTSDGKSSGGRDGKEAPARNPSNVPETGVKWIGGTNDPMSRRTPPVLVGTTASEAPHTIVKGNWIDTSKSDAMEAVITSESAKQLKVDVGDFVMVGSSMGGGDETHLKIVGIVEQVKRLPRPRAMIGLPPSRKAALEGSPSTAIVYVPLGLAEYLTNSDAKATYAGIVLKNNATVESFQEKWRDRFASEKSVPKLQTFEAVASEVDNSTTFEGVRAQAYSATGIALLAALFIIYTTLSMGVSERIRQFAVLRAVCLTKMQVAVMIAIESLMLGAIGWAGGLLAGWGLLKLPLLLEHFDLSETGFWAKIGLANFLAAQKQGLDPNNASLGFWCIALSGICAFGGSLAASILPAWQATSVSPLEAMVPRQRTYSMRASSIVTILGLILIAVNPLVVFWIPMQDTSRYIISAAIGCSAMAIGFILIAPFTIRVIEKYIGPLVARIVGIDYRLLSTQLSSNLWRTLGTTVALTLGLGLFVSMQTWGYSMLGPFTPGSWTPDLVVQFSGGLPDSEIDAVRNTKGFDADKFIPLATKHVKFAEDYTGFNVRDSATRQDTCVMVGVDPEKALGGDDPIFKFEFLKGSREESLAKLKTGGRYCIVPDHFERDTGFTIGDKFSVLVNRNSKEKVEYEIAGVVSMPGWHWMTKMGFRQGRAAGLMFSPIETVKKDFSTGPTTLFWGNIEPELASLKYADLEEKVKKELEPIAERNKNTQRARNGQGNESDAAAPAFAGFGRGGMGGRGAGVNVASAKGVREKITLRAGFIIWTLSQLPLVTLAVTSIGVINAVISSVRARRWDMGVLRAIGITRFNLFRLILAEAFLIGIVACVLSLGFGVMAGYCGTGITRYINIRGGQYTPLIIPWTQLLYGFGITLSLCLLAALWPAIKTGRAEPLRLLQAGRSAM